MTQIKNQTRVAVEMNLNMGPDMFKCALDMYVWDNQWRHHRSAVMRLLGILVEGHHA